MFITAVIVFMIDLKEVLMISDEIHFYQNEGKIERIRIAETEIRKVRKH